MIDERIHRFVEKWYGRSFAPSDGFAFHDLRVQIPSHLVDRLPASVISWYEVAGVWFDTPTGHVFLTSPDRLEVWRRFLSIYNDPHAGLDAGIRECDLSLEDPPVYTDEGCLLYPSFTDFLQALLIRDRLSLDNGAAPTVEPRIPRELLYGEGLRDLIAELCPKHELKPLLTYAVPPGTKVEIFEGDELLAVADGCCWVTATARTMDGWAQVRETMLTRGTPGDSFAFAEWLHSSATHMHCPSLLHIPAGGRLKRKAEP
jgi:hypothetical protein